MRFADYFSRHPTTKVIPPSKEDVSFVINLIDSFKFLLKKADKSSSNRMRENISEQNHVTNTKEPKQTKQHASGHSLPTNQLHSLIEITQKSDKYKSIVNLCTRNYPNKNTIEQTITKRTQQKNMLSTNNSETSPDNTPHSITIGTQTENSSNIGQGLKPLNPL